MPSRFSQTVHHEPYRCIVELSSSIRNCPSLYQRAVQPFIAKPSIAKPSIAEPSIVSRPALYCRAVHCEPSSIASCPSRHRRALHNNIAKPSSALSPSHSCPLPSHSRPSPSSPLPSRPLRRAIHHKLSIAKPSIAPSCPL
jgi:hypothetical protein